MSVPHIYLVSTRNFDQIIFFWSLQSLAFITKKYLLAALLTIVVFLTIDFQGWSFAPSPLSSLFTFTSGPSIFDLLPPKLVDPVAKLVPLPPRSGATLPPSKLLWLPPWPGIVMLVSEALDFALPRLRAFMFCPQLVKFDQYSIKWGAITRRNLVTNSL